VHLSEGDANNRDAKYETIEDVGEPYPNASDEEPEHIHEHVQTARLWYLSFDVGTKRPNGQHTQFETLQSERDADNRNHQYQSCNEILQGYMQASKYDPDDVS
jgi:hypothetical protein